MHPTTVSLAGICLLLIALCAQTEGGALPAQTEAGAPKSAHKAAAKSPPPPAAAKPKPTTVKVAKPAKVVAPCDQTSCDAKCKTVFGNMDPTLHGFGKCQGTPPDCKCDVARK